MSIILNDNIRVNAPKPIEDKRMNNGVPYVDVDEANDLLNEIVDRYESLEVVIGTPTDWAIYWYKDGVGDTDLVLKPESDVTADGNNTFTGLNEFNFITNFNDELHAKSGIYTDGSDIDLGGASIRDLANGSLPSDAVNKSQLDTKLDASAYNEYFRGKFPSKVALDGNTFTPPLKAGDYAQVDAGAGSDVINYSWDADDNEWIEGGSGSGATDTDGLPEGTTNLYFTEARVLGTDLGTVTPSNTAISTGDDLQTLANKAQGQINAKQDALSIASATEVNTGTDNAKLVTALALEGSKYLDRDFTKISATTTGTSTDYVASLTPALTSYVTNQPLILTFNVASGASPTVNVNGLGTKALLRMDGTAIQANDLLTTPKYLFIYDGTAFRMLTPIANENIRNQNASQQSANFWALIGRLDTGLGLGLVANAAAFLSISAATSAKAQMLMTQGTVDYTGSVNGMFWNNAGEIKFLDKSIVNRVVKAYGNELFTSDGNYIGTFNQYGDLSATIPVIEAWVYDEDVITAINTADFDVNGIAILDVDGDEVMYQGQYYYDETDKILYFAIDDNIATILTPNVVVDSAGDKWRIAVSTGGVLSTTAI